MEMKFRPRFYRVEEEACSIPRIPVDKHPLSTPSTSPQQFDGRKILHFFSIGRVAADYVLPIAMKNHLGVHHDLKVVAVDHGVNEFFDPLRGSDEKAAKPLHDLHDEENSSTASTSAIEYPAKEWPSFKKFLMQRFPVSKMVSLSSMSNVIIRSGKVNEKSSPSMHLEELDDPQKYAEEGIKVISQQEYISRLQELKDEITRAWRTEDRVTSLKLSIKVARLLMDTSVVQFYPTLFVLATDVMDMLGDMVWERIRLRAEFAEDGTLICSLREDFEAGNICFDAKETCYNWFCKIGSIRELLPRIYLELAILPCWRFLLDRPMDSLQRLVMMTRGIADPLASAYCRLYIVHRAQKLPQCDIGPIITCINDLKALLMRIVSVKDTTHGKLSGDKKLLLSLMEPTIEYIMNMIFKFSYQTQVGDIVMGMELGRNQSELFGKFQCVSIVLHHLLKELPTEVVCSNGVEILQLIECSDDCSFDQCLNYKLLGFRLSEGICQVNTVTAVIDKVIQIVSQYNSLEEYSRVVDAYVDIVLQNKMGSHVNIILDGIFERACKEGMGENEQAYLQSVFVKLLTHFNNLEDILAKNHFIDILDMMHGSSRSIVNMHILNKATRKGCISNPTTIQLLFEVAQALHDGTDFSNMRNDDNQQAARLISRFVDMVDHGPELERHLTFLIECRGAFGSMNELKETLVHSCNHLAIKAMRDGKNHHNFIKSCVAFSEVTIPSIPAHCVQLNLYLETAEVAMFSGLISHLDGLVDSAISCVQNLDLMDGLRMPNDVDGILSLIRKLCSLMVMAPGNPKQGVTYIPSCILSFLESKSWITPKIKIKMLCAVISFSATLSQNELPYHANNEEVMGNDHLFFGHPTYLQELVSFSDVILQNIVSVILQEPSQAPRGNMALEACNCIASFYKISDEVLAICSKLLETAESCLGANDKYLQNTMNFVHKLTP